MKTRKNKMNVKLFIMAVYTILFAVFMIGPVFLTSFVTAFNDHEATITVTDKERVNASSSSYYLVFGKDEYGNVVVYENSDEILRGKWDSSTLQAGLEIGETYNVVLVGYRIPFWSMYENILEIEKVTSYE